MIVVLTVHVLMNNKAKRSSCDADDSSPTLPVMRVFVKLPIFFVKKKQDNYSALKITKIDL